MNIFASAFVISFLVLAVGFITQKILIKREIKWSFPNMNNQNVKDNELELSSQTQELLYSKVLLYTSVVGIIGGLVATAYYFVLEHFLELVWETGKHYFIGIFPDWFPAWNYTWIVSTIGGFGVGLCLYFFGQPGEMAKVIEKIHDPGRLEPSQTPGIIATSLVSITAGGSLGPEAPLVQINGSLGSWIADKLNLSLKETRFFTGASLGLAISFLIPAVHPTIAMLCCMVAINVSITKTPISTSIILSVLSDTSIIPIIAIASFTSFILTSNIGLLRTQRPRKQVEHPQCLIKTVLHEQEVSNISNRVCGFVFAE